LGVLYGKSAYTVARECGITVAEAKQLLKFHKRLFPKFWLWIDWVVNEALATRKISTKLGWIRLLPSKADRDAHNRETGVTKSVVNSLRNFPSQSHGAEMLRLALIYATEQGLGICAPLHDAIFMVATTDTEDWAIATLKDCMGRAALDLIGVRVPVEITVIRYPDRYVPHKKPMALKVWGKMMVSLEREEGLQNG
jgi:DNA polymerase I-like protein with 3'-5' exonuclease and polymerase domains